MSHHNPFQYIERIMESPERRAQIQDVSEFQAALSRGTLPAVAFVKPQWAENAREFLASSLKLIEWRWGLAPLTERDRQASAFLEAFDFSQPARAAIVLD